MVKHRFTDQELRFTAVIYATRPGLVEHLRTTGRLPDERELGGFPVAMRVLVDRRGRDVTLSEAEQLVYEAILREKRLPSGGVVFSWGPAPVFVLDEENMKIDPGEKDWKNMN